MTTNLNGEAVDSASVNDDDAGTANQRGMPETIGDSQSEAIARVRREYEEKLLLANLRTEAVRAGMVDLDGLKLIDPATVRRDDDGNIEDGKRLMADLRRRKPWLFVSMSSSTPGIPPTSVPPRQKMAMDMTDEEYVSARATLIKNSY